MTTALAVVNAWARETEDRLRRVLRASAQDVAENVSVGGAFSPGTPVDTGFARSMWVASKDDGPVAAEVVPAGLRHGEYAFELEGNAGAAASDMNLVCGSADLGDTITLTNRTEYLPYLEDGSTPIKAVGFTSGWIAQTVNAWPTIVAQAVERVRSAA